MDLDDFEQNQEMEINNLNMWKQNVQQLENLHKNLIDGIERDRIK